jgi:hypothetical protein
MNVWVTMPQKPVSVILVYSLGQHNIFKNSVAWVRERPSDYHLPIVLYGNTSLTKEVTKERTVDYSGNKQLVIVTKVLW